MIVEILRKRIGRSTLGRSRPAVPGWASTGDDPTMGSRDQRSGAEKGKTKTMTKSGLGGLAKEIRRAMEVKPTPNTKNNISTQLQRGDCWHKYCIAQSTDGEPQEDARFRVKSIKGTAAMSPAWRGRILGQIHSLYRVLQQEMLDLWA